MTCGGSAADAAINSAHRPQRLEHLEQRRHVGQDDVVQRPDEGLGFAAAGEPETSVRAKTEAAQDVVRNVLLRCIFWWEQRGCYDAHALEFT